MLRRITVGIRLATFALACAWSASAQAVILSAFDDSPNLISPGEGTGWSNLATISGSGTLGSAVYLGNRWVLTANHVTGFSIKLTDGRVFKGSIGSDERVNNPASHGGGAADLRMFRLADDPGMPALQIVSTAAAAGTQVRMIGAGRDRADQQIGWKITGSGPTTVWTEVPLPQANASGFNLVDSTVMRWGMNLVLSNSPIYFNQGNTWVFSTRFDAAGIPFESQATTGDSGGGVFQFADGVWKLAGIMNAVQPITGQPANTVAFGDLSYAADLSIYRDAILSLVNKTEPVWQNQVNYFDVDRSNAVNPRDVLQLANRLLLHPNETLNGTPGPNDMRYDVNGDLKLTSRDLVLVVSNILFPPPALPSAASDSSGAQLVPEPAAWAQGIAAAVTLCAAAAWRRRKKTAAL